VKSIRTTLAVGLIATALVAGALVAYGVYRSAYEQANELFDYQLRQMGIALRDRIFEGRGATAIDAEDFLVQVWRADGSVVFVSSPRVIPPVLAPVGLSTVVSPGGDWRVYRIDAASQIVQVAQPMSLRRDRAAASAGRVLVPVIVALPVLAVLIWLVVSRGLAPLTGLARSLAARGPRALAPLPEAGLPEEVRPLVGSLNDLLARLERALDRERAFIADAAHELRTPLAAVGLQLQVLERVSAGAEREQALERLKSGVQRAARLVGQLLDLARQDDAADRRTARVDLAAVAREVVLEQAQQAEARRIDLGLEGAAAEVEGDAEGLRVALGNLVDNAIRHSPHGGRVDVRVRTDGADVVAEVVDSGPGIPPAERERVFDRFHRGESAAGSGSGLGLAIVREIATRHGATVELADRADGTPGLCARLRFRRA
jgi:two-component system OmpR family sensor kinase